MKHLVYDSVFQSGFLRNLGFRETIPGVRRNADKILVILCVVFTFIDVSTIILVYEYEVIYKNKDITFIDRLLLKESGA